MERHPLTKKMRDIGTPPPKMHDRILEQRPDVKFLTAHAVPLSTMCCEYDANEICWILSQIP